MTWLQKRRPCPRNHSVRSVWRASVLDQFWLRGRMCKIYKKTNGFRGACPPNHCVRNVSRASSFPSAGHPRGSLDHSLGHLGTPWPPKGFSIIVIHSSIHASIPPSMFFPDIPSCILRGRISPHKTYFPEFWFRSGFRIYSGFCNFWIKAISSFSFRPIFFKLGRKLLWLRNQNLFSGILI